MAQFVRTGITSANYTQTINTLQLPLGAEASINFWQTDTTGGTAVPQTTSLDFANTSLLAASWVDSPSGPQTTIATMILVGQDTGLRLRPVTGTWAFVVNYTIDRDILLGPTA